MQLRSFVTGILAGAFPLLLASAAFGQTKQFTLTADFNAGTLNNVGDTVPADEVVLGPTAVSKTHLVWVDNYLYGYVVRIDSQTGYQTSRFDSGLVTINGQATGAQPAQTYCDFATNGNCPGRVAVDPNGDVWIVNRAFSKQGTLSKFSGNLAHCIDRNNNGIIDTSFDKNLDGIIDVTPAAGEYFGQNDECILTTIPIGPVNALPRGVAVDKRGKIWVSTFNDGKVYRYNPNEPVALEATVNVGGNPYSMATGGDYVFISKSGGPTTRVHITTLAVSSVPCPGTYGVVADPSGNVAWLGGYYSGTGVYKADFIANTCTNWATPGNVTAMTLDLAGNIWAAGYSLNVVHKFSPAGVLLGTYPAGGGGAPHGLSVDFGGNVWLVSDGAPSLTVFNSNTGALLGTFGIGGIGVTIPNPTPYLYSDFTGTQINRQAPYAYVGSWDGVYDGGVPNIPWSKVSWNSEPQGAVPAETSLVVSVRAANTLAALGAASYLPVMNGAILANVKGQFVQVKTDLKGPGFATSVLSDISVIGPCGVIGQACCLKDTDCTDANTCTLDTCPVPGGSCVHTLSPNCCLVDADCNDQNACTADTCPVAGGTCSYSAPKPGCCSSNSECSDGNLCTADLCSGPGGTCSFPLINGCCNADIDCTKGNKCSNATCPVPGGFCVGGNIPGCCAVDADCADNDLCTLDKCDLAQGKCTNTAVQGCCNVDGQCNDNEACTSDKCSGPGGVCQFSPIANCCAMNDPKIGAPCDIPVSPNDQPPCKPGKLVCTAGKFDCVGAVGPQLEVCDGLDNNCDGIVDTGAMCPANEVCIDGTCVAACKQGEFPCPGGYVCVKGYCMPDDCKGVVCPGGEVCQAGACMSADGGTSSSSGSSSSGASSGSSSSGSSSTSSGNTSSGAGGAGGQSSASSSGVGGASSSGALPGNGAPPQDTWGLATGGACRCSVPGEQEPGHERSGLALALLGALGWLGRRRPANGRGARRQGGAS